MVFASPIFLYLFLPAYILLYMFAPNVTGGLRDCRRTGKFSLSAFMPSLRSQNAMLTLLSLFFYAWGEPVWVVLLLFSSLVDYVVGRVIGIFRGRPQAKIALICSIVINLSLLGTFKYLDFFLESLGLLTGVRMPSFGIELPIGISFYTFQTMSYSIDAYKGSVKIQKSFPDFLLFVSLFPQLIAGPILRYSDIEDQLSNRTVTWELVASGVTRFACGLGKKVLIANIAGEIGTKILDGNLDGLPAADAWVGILMFTAQIYFDFSGYSDMAIGLGRMFGFDYTENFRYPYMSRSVTDFWRRWHITLGSFFRDYVYIPLGGNKKRQIFNLFVTWALTGLWHGASWNFVLWGLYYFVLLVIEKIIIKPLAGKLGHWWGWLYTFPLVVLGWVLFYFTDMNRLGVFAGALFGSGGLAGPETSTLWLGNLPLIILCAVAASPVPAILAKGFIGADAKPGTGRRLTGASGNLAGGLTIAFNTIVLAMCTLMLLRQSYNPFLYFRF